MWCLKDISLIRTENGEYAGNCTIRASLRKIDLLTTMSYGEIFSGIKLRIL